MKKYKPICPFTNHKLVDGFGAGGRRPKQRAKTTLEWCQALRTGISDDFKEGISLVDWGCGAGRFGNFMSSQLKDFEYLGYELDNQHGRSAIGIANKLLKDSRLLFTNDWLQALVRVSKADVVLFGSVLTHLTIEHSMNLLSTLFRQNPSISCVFSLAVGDNYYLGRRGVYKHSDCYRMVIYSDDEMNSLKSIANIEHLSDFPTSIYTHRIMRATLR